MLISSSIGGRLGAPPPGWSEWCGCDHTWVRLCVDVRFPGAGRHPGGMAMAGSDRPPCRSPRLLAHPVLLPVLLRGLALPRPRQHLLLSSFPSSHARGRDVVSPVVWVCISLRTGNGRLSTCPWATRMSLETCLLRSLPTLKLGFFYLLSCKFLKYTVGSTVT